MSGRPAWLTHRWSTSTARWQRTVEVPCGRADDQVCRRSREPAPGSRRGRSHCQLGAAVDRGDCAPLSAEAGWCGKPGATVTKQEMIEFWATVRPPCAAAAAKVTPCWSGSPEHHCPMLIPASDDSADCMTCLFLPVCPSPGIRRVRHNEPAGERAEVDELLDPHVHPQMQPLIGHVRSYRADRSTIPIVERLARLESLGCGC